MHPQFIAGFVERANSQGLTSLQALQLLKVAGDSNAIGRLMAGKALRDQPGLEPDAMQSGGLASMLPIGAQIAHNYATLGNTPEERERTMLDVGNKLEDRSYADNIKQNAKAIPTYAAVGGVTGALAPVVKEHIANAVKNIPGVTKAMQAIHENPAMVGAKNVISSNPIINAIKDKLKSVGSSGSSSVLKNFAMRNPILSGSIGGTIAGATMPITESIIHSLIAKHTSKESKKRAAKMIADHPIATALPGGAIGGALLS